MEDAIKSREEQTGRSSYLFPEKEAVAHPPVFFNGYELVVKAEHKRLGMIFDSKAQFSKPC